MKPYGECHGSGPRGIPRTETTPAGIRVVLAKTTRAMLRRQWKKRARQAVRREKSE